MFIEDTRRPSRIDDEIDEFIGNNSTPSIGPATGTSITRFRSARRVRSPASLRISISDDAGVKDESPNHIAYCGELPGVCLHAGVSNSWAFATPQQPMRHMATVCAIAYILTHRIHISFFSYLTLSRSPSRDLTTTFVSCPSPLYIWRQSDVDRRFEGAIPWEIDLHRGDMQAGIELREQRLRAIP